MVLTIMADPKADAFTKWYGSNAATMNARRRERYANDPEYKDRVLKQRTASRERRKKKDLVERKLVKKAAKIRVAPGWRAVESVSADVTTPMFTIGALVQATGMAIQTLRGWSKTGVLPETPYRNPKGDRLYTAEMIEAIVVALKQNGRIPDRKMVRRTWVDCEITFADGHVEERRLFYISTLAKVVGRVQSSLMFLEAKGVLPSTSLKLSAIGRRLYTREMMEAVKDAFDARGGRLEKDDWSQFYEDVENAWRKLGVLGATAKRSGGKTDGSEQGSEGSDDGGSDLVQGPEREGEGDDGHADVDEGVGG